MHIRRLSPIILYLGDAPTRIDLTLLTRDKRNIAPLVPPVIELDHDGVAELFVQPDGRSALVRPVGLGECVLRVSEAPFDAHSPARESYIEQLDAKVESGAITRGQADEQLAAWDRNANVAARPAPHAVPPRISAAEQNRRDLAGEIYDSNGNRIDTSRFDANGVDQHGNKLSGVEMEQFNRQKAFREGRPVPGLSTRAAVAPEGADAIEPASIVTLILVLPANSNSLHLSVGQPDAANVFPETEAERKARIEAKGKPDTAKGAGDRLAAERSRIVTDLDQQVRAGRITQQQATQRLSAWDSADPGARGARLPERSAARRGDEPESRDQAIARLGLSSDATDAEISEADAKARNRE